MYDYTDLWTKYIIIVYMMIGVYVVTRTLDKHTVEEHNTYSIVATFLTLVWPLVVMYNISKKIIKK